LEQAVNEVFGSEEGSPQRVNSDVIFNEEIDSVCASRDLLIIKYAKSYKMYNSFEEFFDLVSAQFKLVPVVDEESKDTDNVSE